MQKGVVLVVEVAAFFITYAHHLGDFLRVEGVVAELPDEVGHLLVFVRSLVPLGMRLLDDANQDAEVRIPICRGVERGDSIGKKLCVSPNLSVGNLCLVYVIRHSYGKNRDRM